MRLLISSVFAVLIVLSVACGEKEKAEIKKSETMSNQSISASVRTVTVEEKLDAGNYSYLKVNENGKSFWIAVNLMDIKAGELIAFSKYIEMKDFKSETLNRTFESVLFVDDARKSGDEKMEIKASHSNIATSKDGSIKVESLKDGYSIEQIYAKKSSLENKTVKVKGVVVKVNNEIMGTNWIHIQDGTGNDGTHDLLVTTSETVQVGKTIIAEGKVIKDKDFGSGYFYDVLLEKCKISIQ
jgi:hypothetical protein